MTDFYLASSFWTKTLPRSICISILFFLLGFLLYKPGLNDFWLYDDFSNIVKNPEVYIETLSVDELVTVAQSGIAGPLLRPVAMVSFSLNYYFSGMDAAAFKLVNVVLHALNAVVLFFFLSVLLKHCLQLSPGMDWLDDRKIFYISLYVASLWLIHPFNLTNVLYVVQRMNSLAFLFMASSALMYMHMRMAMIESRSFFIYCFLLPVVFLLAIFSKENAFTIGLFFLFLEFMLYRFDSASIFWRKFLPLAYGVAIVASLFLLVWYWDRYFLVGYRGRDFNAYERLLTESRVLFIYLRQIIVPDISSMFLHHDALVISRSLLSPPMTLLALLGVLSLWFFAWLVRKKQMLFSLGVGLFFTTHVLESSIFPLALYFEHRNYFPMIGILLALSGPGAYLYFIKSEKNKKIFLLLILLVPILFAVTTTQRVLSWQSEDIWVTSELARNPDSSGANYEYASRLFNIALASEPNEQKFLAGEAKKYFLKAQKLDPSNLITYTAIMRLDEQFNGFFNEHEYNKLMRRMEEHPFSRVESIIIVEELFGCNIMKICHFPNEKISEFLYFLVNHPAVTGSEKFAIEVNIVSLLYESGEIEEALTSILNIIEHAGPDVNSSVRFSSWLMLLEIELRKGRIVHYENLKERYVNTLSIKQWEKLDAKKLAGPTVNGK